MISCRVARYSAAFVCKSMEIYGNPCRITRSTVQNLICYRMSVSRASGTLCCSVFGRFCVSRFRIGVTLGLIFMKIMEDNGWKVKNGPQEWHIDVEWHMQCISYRLVSDPNRPKAEHIQFSYKICLSKPGLATPTERTIERPGAVGEGRGG